MVARAFVVNVAENALDRIGLRAIARQPNQFETGMLFQPAVNRFRLMNLVIVAKAYARESGPNGGSDETEWKIFSTTAYIRLSIG